MPLSRYQIRNEYSLADAELYRAADKDDPEALLEGVAMAGLVGVLRQLGDLAEFAAEIFHDLHEQVIATASRGHSLMVRVQQLEAEFPSIEKAFLSQISHSSFYYNPGTEWHPNLRLDQNLITHGDLPRFVMDSYEECRGPPRLFLLDKFDVAGAEACLKRYTDPSIFRLESSYSDGLREKKPRRAKKKGPRWRNGETPETLPTSHAKLHQLFLEERIENDTNNSSRRVKLKRRLNGFPFDTKSGKSCMAKFLESLPPNKEEVHEIPVDLSPSALPSYGTYESAFEVVEISTISPEKESKQRIRSTFASSDREETTLELVNTNGQNGISNGKMSIQNPSLEAYEISLTLHTEPDEKDIPVDGGMKTEAVIDDNASDVASEIDNYVDALATMESEIDTDSELRAKHDLHYMNGRGQVSDIDANDEKVEGHSSDSVSSGNSTLYDDGSSSSMKDLSTFSNSDTHSTSAEISPLDDEVSQKVSTYTEIHEVEPRTILQSIDVERQTFQPPEDTSCDGVYAEASEVPSAGPRAGTRPSGSRIIYENAEGAVKDIPSVAPKTDEMVTSSMDLTYIPCIADVCQQQGKGDCVASNASGEILDEFEDDVTTKTENLGCTSCLSVQSLSKCDFPLQVQSEKQFVDELDVEVVNQDENAASTSDCLKLPATVDDNHSLLHPENQPMDQLLDEDKLSSAKNPSDDLLQFRDDLSLTISPENLPLNDFGIEEPNLILNTFIGLSNIAEISTEGSSTENKLECVPQISHVEDNFVPNSVENNVGPQDSVMLLPENQPCNPMNEELETCYSRVELDERVSEDESTPPAGEKMQNASFNVDTHIIFESADSFDSETKANVLLPESSGERSSSLREEDYGEASNVVDGAVMDEASSGLDCVKSNAAAEQSLLSKVPPHLKEVCYEPVTVATAFAGDDNDTIDVVDDYSSVDVKKLQEGSLSSNGDEHCELEIDTHSSKQPEQSDIMDDAYQHKFTSPDLKSLPDMLVENDSGSQVCDDDRYLVLGEESVLQNDNAPTAESGEESVLEIDNDPSTQLSVRQNVQVPRNLEENFDCQSKQFGTELHSECDDSLGLSTDLQQAPFLNDKDPLGTFDASSAFLLNGITSQPSANIKFDISEHYLDPSNSISSSFSLLPDPGQICLEEMPPLPPLPPVQWMMGKFQNASSAHQRVVESHSSTAFSSPLPSGVSQEPQDVIPFLPQSVLAHEKPTPVSEQPICNSSPFLSPVPPLVHHGDPEDDKLPPEGVQCISTPLLLSGSHGEMLQNDYDGAEGEKVKSHLNPFHEARVPDASASYSSSLSHEGIITPLNQMMPEPSLSFLELGQQSAYSEDNIVNTDTTEISLNVSRKDAIPTLEENVSWPIAEDGKTHVSRTRKQPLPRNPLIDAVVALDKSKLRKVPQRVKSQIQKEDERDSLLEQIRTKSFNLKPAVVTRSSIRGPKTNLKVAAILEKAKTIRQAFAGSDEDDDDNSWSDS